MKTIRISVYLFICTLIFSCAQIVAPGGGKKDTTPPKVVKYLPDSAALNFNSKMILIDFDEYVVLKDLNSQLIISPPFDKSPDIAVKNKTLTIAFDKKEVLKPNTTYCISFGNSLQDLNENNPYENFKYIFSTGTYIDSLSLKGKVENGFNHGVEKGILVMLYADMSDSVIFKSLPDYFTKTKEDGTFQINNIKPGKYKLIALKDANSNYKYDSETESIGFVDAPIDVSEKNNILIDLFQEPAKKVFLKKHFHDQYGKIVLVFNQGTDSLRVTALNNDQKGVQEQIEFSQKKDTLTYWIKNFEKDTLKLQVNNGNKVLDTLEFKMIKKEEALKSKKHPLKLTLLNNFNGNQSFDINGLLNLMFSQPIATINAPAGVQLKEDTVNYKERVHLGYMKTFNPFVTAQGITIGLWDSSVTSEDPNNPGVFIASPTFTSIIPLKENTNYHLFIPPGTFTDIFGLTNDTLKIDFKTKEEKFYGSGKLEVTAPEINANYIVQLLDEKENVVREDIISKTGTINYTYLYPQKYKLKIIYDEDGNGKWDSGNYLQKIQPEKVIYDPELINVRSNWDVDLKWDLMNIK